MGKLFLSLFKVTLGVALAMVVLSLASVATARYFMAKLSVLPEKPLYESETGTPELVSDQTSETADAVPSTANLSDPEAEPSPVQAEDLADPADAPLEPGTYKAVVVQPIGLVLREGPGREYPQLGGVEYNETIIVLGQNSENTWLNVRLLGSGQEGWVKAGNTQPLDGELPETGTVEAGTVETEPSDSSAAGEAGQ